MNRTLFGIDLRRWSDGWSSPHDEAQNKLLVPPVLTTLLDGLTQAYLKMPNDLGESVVYPIPRLIVIVWRRETKSLDLRSFSECDEQK
jgi:hypothetical protein